VQREADVSTQQPAAQADSRLSGSDAHQERPCGDRTSAPEGSSPPSRLMSEAQDPPRSFLPPESCRGASRNEGFRSEDRLRRRADFLRCYRTGRRRTGSLSILYFVPNVEGRPRLGVTASRKVGNSVVRHRLKRRIRETYRRWPGRGEIPALDLVVHLKPEAAKADPRIFAEDLIRLWRGTVQRAPYGGSR
jgi:ribonuclease P protein component